MFILVSTAHFVDPGSGSPEDPHQEVLRTAAIVRVRPWVAPGGHQPYCKVTVAEVGDLLVLESFPKFLVRLYRAAGCKPPEGSA